MKTAPAITPAVRLLKTKDAARVYGVTPLFLHRVPVDQLPRVKIGYRSVLYDVNDLEAYFKSRKAS